MGQYHHLVNLDKCESLDPHPLGMGLKQWEQVSEHTALILVALLSCSNGRGGGDLPVVDGINGRWAGDRVVFVGDYSEEGDVPGYDGIEHVYGLIGSTQADVDEVDQDGNRYYPEGAKPFTDITPLLVEYIERVEGGMFIRDGWRQFVCKDQRVAMWRDPRPTEGDPKMHGTIVALNRDGGTFSVTWDGGPTMHYTREDAPYLMSSDQPGPRMAPDMILMGER